MPYTFGDTPESPLGSASALVVMGVERLICDEGHAI